MERASPIAKKIVPPPPVHAPPVKSSPTLAPTTSSAALQSRMGAAGARHFLLKRTGGPGKRTPGATHDAVNDKAPAPEGHKAQPGHGKAPHCKAHPAEAGDEKTKAGPAAEEEVPAGGAAREAAAPVKLHMPEPPTKPSKATMRRIAGVKARAGGKAKAQATLPPASKQVGDAQKGVTSPDAERIAEARARLIAEVHAAPSPEIVALCARIRQVIRDKRPPDEDALATAEPAKEAADAGNQLNSTVQSESKKVSDNYGPMNNAPAPAQPTPGAPIPPQPAAAPTPPVNAKAAVPDPVPPQSVSLEKDAEDSRKKADSAGMNKPAAALVQSGPIAEAREAQGELDQVAKEDPAQVLAKEKEALAKADEDMAALQLRALQALTQDRAGTATKSTQRQKGMVGTEEQMRAQAGADAKAAFDEAQSTVKGLLKDLVPNAMNKWETAKAALTRQFKDDLAIVKKRVDERHSGATGFVVGLWDAVTGLPDWATDAYDRAENNFAEGVIAKLTEISTEVNSVIQACEAIIKKARDKIAEIFASLPDSLKGWAAQEQEKFDKDLDKLGEEVVAQRNAFNKDITQRASEAVDEVRAEISELRKKAGGLVGRIVDAVKRFVDDPVKFIIEGLLELLGISPPAFWAVVAKIKKVVKDIIDDPVNFANNLLKGIGQGFSQFFDNFAEHMIRGFLSWLLGDLKDVQIPKEISVKSIITFFLQLMGITWPNIRKILAKKIGEKNVALIEKVYSLISMLIEKGPEGIYEMVKEKLEPQAIVDQVIQMAVEYMVTAIAKQVAVRLLLLFNPAGAILQAIEAIYRVLKWVFQNAARIFTLIETIVNGLADIIAGNVGGFANAVEKGLAMLIPPVLGFIADYFSLGDLPKTVAKQIQSFREWILGKIEAGFDWVIAKGKQLLAALGIGKKEKDKGKGEEGGTVGEEVSFEAGGEQHRLWIRTDGSGSTVMVASNEQGLDDFLKSKAVREAASADGQVAGMVSNARAKWKQLDLDADAIVKALKDIKDEKKEGNTTSQNNKVKSEEHQLAELISAIMDAIAVSQPFAGLHGIIRQVTTKDKKPRNSHHVPAKALGVAIATVLHDIALRLTVDPWDGEKQAQRLSDQLMIHAQEDMSLADTGDELSAISLSYKSHKGVRFGVHSLGSARVLQGIARNPARTRILQARRKTEVWIGKNRSFVSVNPSVSSWRVFLADIHRQLEQKRERMDLGKGRTAEHDNAAEEILDEAEAEMFAAEDSTREILQDTVVDKVNEMISDAPKRAYKNGKIVVKEAMQNYHDGDPDGQASALNDLDNSFNSSWAPIRDPISF